MTNHQQPFREEITMTTTPKRRFRRRFVAIAVAGCVFIGAAGALAYFVSRGSGTTATNVTTGTAATLPVTVVLGPSTGSPLTPAGTAQTFTVQVHNANNVPVDYLLTAAVRSDGAGGVYDTTSGGFVDACLASWYGVTLSVTSPVTQPANTLLNEGSGSVTMSDNGADQSACESLTPEIDVTAS